MPGLRQVLRRQLLRYALFMQVAEALRSDPGVLLFTSLGH